jgi:hypothetical protein
MYNDFILFERPLDDYKAIFQHLPFDNNISYEHLTMEQINDIKAITAFELWWSNLRGTYFLDSDYWKEASKSVFMYLNGADYKSFIERGGIILEGHNAKLADEKIKLCTITEISKN